MHICLAHVNIPQRNNRISVYICLYLQRCPGPMVQGPQDAYRRTLRLFHEVERDWPAGAHAFHPCIDSPSKGENEISVLIELPTWPNYVFCTDQLRKETGVAATLPEPQRR